MIYVLIIDFILFISIATFSYCRGQWFQGGWSGDKGDLLRRKRGLDNNNTDNYLYGGWEIEPGEGCYATEMDNS